jgi:integral membrane protein
MIKLFKTNIGRLRLIGLLEGISLLILVGIAVPLKYGSDNPSFVKMMGPLHGSLFLLFVFNTFSVSIQQKWKASITIKVLISCLIPFGTFYVDHKILKPAYQEAIHNGEA